MSKSVVYKFGQKKSLEEKYGKAVLQFKKQRKTLLDVQETMPKKEMVFITKGEHPDVLQSKVSKKKKSSPAKKTLKKNTPPKVSPKKVSPPKKTLKRTSPSKISPKKISKTLSTKKLKGKKTEKEVVDVSIEYIEENVKKPNLPTSKNNFTQRDKVYEKNIVELVFPKTKTILIPAEKNIKIQKDQVLEPIEDLEKRKLVLENRITILRNLDARKLDGFMEGKRKNKFTKGELLKISQQLGLPVKNSETRGSFVEKIKNMYIKNEIPMKLGK